MNLMPAWLDPELRGYLLTLALLLLVGVPRVKARVRLQRNLGGEELPPEAWSPAQRQAADTGDRRLAELGFHPMFSATFHGLGGANFCRFYAAKSSGTLAMAAFLSQQSGEHLSVENVLEFLTSFADGSVHSTKNASLASVFPPVPWKTSLDLPVDTPLSRLHAAHEDAVRERTRRIGVKAPPRDAVESLARTQAEHERFIDHHVAHGCLRQVAVGVYAPTAKLAWRGVRNHLNPFAEAFSWRAFLLGTLGCALGPALLIRALVSPEALAALGEGIIVKVEIHAVGMLTYASAGWVLARLFDKKLFVWGFLLGYLPAKLLIPPPFSPYLLAAVLGGSAAMAQQRRAWKRRVA